MENSLLSRFLIWACPSAFASGRAATGFALLRATHPRSARPFASLTLGIAVLLSLASTPFTSTANTLGDSVLYVDYRPQYTQWMDNYILDKIVYTQNRTIFHFRFVVTAGGGLVTYYGPKGASPWYLKNISATKPGDKLAYELIEINNIAVNGVVVVKNLRTSPEFEMTQEDNAVYTCEVHFERLKPGTSKVDLIEGRGNERSELHFNCFAVTVKPPNSEELGTPADMARKVNEFETKMGAKNKSVIAVESGNVNKAPNTANEPKAEAKAVYPKVQVYFLENDAKSTCVEINQNNLDWVVERLMSDKSLKVRITGYADIKGEPAKMQALSEKRTNAVYKYLRQRGVPANRIIKDSKGSANPIHEKGSGRNRRVEIELIKE
jgi:outer membrane protein OmpA-like peptidoglycan-associated protein